MNFGYCVLKTGNLTNVVYCSVSSGTVYTKRMSDLYFAIYYEWSHRCGGIVYPDSVSPET